ncbi:MAG: hypothetical protein R2715_19300 [Ilumatobacteraceae bacterium]
MRTPFELAKSMAGMLGEPAQPTPGSTVGLVRDALAQLGDAEPARSPLWGQRSSRRKLVPLRAPIGPVQAAARAKGAR